MQLQAGVHYPRSSTELVAWFADDDACADYLDWLRWPQRFTCPHCRGVRSWTTADGTRQCATCQRHVSPTANTAFHATRTPLTTWFTVAWLISSRKGGVSAADVQRAVGLRSYSTAWGMLGSYRRAMADAACVSALTGRVSAEVVRLGGGRKGRGRARRPVGDTWVLIAAENRSGQQLGNCRLAALANPDPDAVADAARRCIATGSELTTLLTDQLATTAAADHYTLRPAGAGDTTHLAAQLTAGAAWRWLLRTHHGAVSADSLQSYLDEFCFRYNQRDASPGYVFYQLLAAAVGAPAQLAGLPETAEPAPHRPTSARPWRQQPPPRGSAQRWRHLRHR
jgi:hypothetical protein